MFGGATMIAIKMFDIWAFLIVVTRNGPNGSSSPMFHDMDVSFVVSQLHFTFHGDETKLGMEDIKFNTKSTRIVFVTVGTTCFDALVKAVDTEQVKQKLYARGYTHILIQMGRGTYNPTKSQGEDGLVVDYFSFSSSIADHLKSASLVISHAGSGSIFETLRLNKPLIVVVNEDLMDNHQIELAEELAERKHLYCARPQTLHQTIEGMELESLIPYTQGDAKPVAKLIYRFLGFPED